MHMLLSVYACIFTSGSTAQITDKRTSRQEDRQTNKTRRQKAEHRCET